MFKSKKEADKKSAKQPYDIKYLGGLLFSKMAAGGAAELANNAEEVNKLNVFPVPDGDTGDNMRMTIESGILAIENMDSDDLAEVMNVLSHGMLLGARGNSGVILSQFFAGAAKGFTGKKQADPATVGHAFELGVKQAYTSVVTPTEGTILTVAREGVEYAISRIDPESTIRSFFADLVKEMHESLERTPEKLAVLKEAGVVDSGGAGLFYIIDGFNKVLNGEEISGGSLLNRSQKTQPKLGAFNADSEMKYGYCTELLLQLTHKKMPDTDAFDLDALKEFLAGLGDSIVAFKTDDIVKIHVHTFTPDRVLSHCLQFGEFLTVKIENMSVQHTETLINENEVPTAPKKYGVVAVCSGSGIEALFRELGTDAVVPGGQTQNPSTNDFLDAFAKVNAEHIFAFPNNSNILMAASQAAELYDKATVHVIPSKSVGTGYVALSSADFEEDDAKNIVSCMTEAMKRVSSGYVSPSIRDAEINGVHITKGDTIGVVEKKIVLSESDKILAATKLAKKMLAGDDKFMLTVFCGKDASADERAVLENNITDACPDAEVYFIDGGQDIYPFIFVAE